MMAERGGFEPPVELPPQQFSRLPPSTTRPPLRGSQVYSLTSHASQRISSFYTIRYVSETAPSRYKTLRYYTLLLLYNKQQNSLDIQLVGLSRLISQIYKKPRKHLTALCLEHPRCNPIGMIQPSVSHNIIHRPEGARFSIPASIYQPADPCKHESTGTHETRLQCHVDHGILKPPPPESGRRLPNDKEFCMG